ncbi:DUF5801 repeats-in-toxin domain-containing protein [Legionella birminghamensis]|uniref:Structural toxin protein RtxA n=3 Tax=Legionella birminghamensis TaxID=28083 RepID=A0A378I8D7_9GAMM|nr:DUF5801 repeats-in-toxin domain-containing protein [Legionella birminghamensis]STX31419.1 structural toxin protein RtxA [Legionella birminghamensis]
MVKATSSRIFSQLALNDHPGISIHLGVIQIQVAKVLPLFFSNAEFPVNSSFFDEPNPKYPPANVAERDSPQSAVNFFDYLFTLFSSPGASDLLFPELDNQDGFTFVIYNPYYSYGRVGAGYDTLSIEYADFKRINPNWYYLTDRLELLEDIAEARAESKEDANPSVSFSLSESGLLGGNNPNAETSFSGSLAVFNMQNNVLSLAGGSGTMPLTANDLPITYRVEDSRLIAQAGGETIFILEILPNNEFHFQLNNSIDHPLPGPDHIVIDLSQFIQIGDNSLPPGTFIITINDDLPLTDPSNNQQPMLHEDGLPGANIDTANPIAEISGTLSGLISFGADGDGGFHFLPEPVLTTILNTLELSSGGQALDYQVVNGILNATKPDGSTVFNFELNLDGSYQFSLQQQLDHLGSHSVATPIPLGFLIQAMDGDGDSMTLNNQFTIVIADDTPFVLLSNNMPAPLLAGDSILNVALSIDLADSFIPLGGADGLSSVNYHLQVNTAISGLNDSLSGLPVVLSLNSSGDVVGYAGINLVLIISIDSDAELTFTQFRPLIHPDQTSINELIQFPSGLVSVVAAAVDGDGDQNSAFLDISSLISIQDAGPELVVIDPGSNALLVDEASLAVNSSILLSTLFSSDAGPDGGSTDYQFQLAGTNSGLIDSLSGLPVLLSINAGGNVEGRAGGLLVFTLSVDASSIVLDLDRAVIHASGNGTNTLLFPEDIISLVATVTDGDQDTVTDSVDVGALIQIIDGIPALSVDGSVLGSLTVNENTLNNTASLSLAAAFTAAIGADGSQPIAYNLQIDNTNSGLTDTLSQEMVVLSQNGNVVEGRTQLGDELVFTISLASDGELSFTQLRPVVHVDGNGTNLINFGSGIVSVQGSLSDLDGDNSTAQLDLGTVISIIDDIPVLTVDAGQIGSLSVLESQLGVTDSVSLAAAFARDLGADGGSVTYGLEIRESNSGLIDSLSGAAVLLSNNNGVIEGFANGGLVFSISIDATGLISFTQLRAIVHPDISNPAESISFPANIIDVVATAIDGDNDPATAAIDLGSVVSIQDAGPELAVIDPGANALLVDEASLGVNSSILLNTVFNSDAGPDGGSTDYQFQLAGTNSGLIDSLSGLPVLLSINAGGNVEGRAGGLLVFTLSVDASSIVLDLDRGVIHASGNGMNALLFPQDIISLVATVTDGDQDTVTDSLDVGALIQVIDGIPALSVDGSVLGGLAVDENTLNNTASLSLAAAFTAAIGADGSQPIAYNLQIDNTNSGLTDILSQEMVVLSQNGNVVEGRTQLGDELVFTISLASDGELSFTQLRPVVHADGNDTNLINFGSGIVSVQGSLSDLDGDNSTAQLDLGAVISIRDDIPALTVDSLQAPMLVVNENQLGIASNASIAAAFSSELGADGGDLSYSLEIQGGDNSDSGLVDSLTGAAILLSNNNGVIEGNANGQLVFTVSINSAGLVSFTQLRSMVHPDGGGANALTLAVNSLFVIAAALDGDNDLVTAQLSLGEHLQVTDAMPSLSGTTFSGTVHEDALAIGNSEGGQTLSLSGSLSALASAGNDGAQWGFSADFNSVLTANNLTANGIALSYTLNGSILTASAGGIDMFSFELNSAGDYLFNLLAAIDHPLANGNDLEQVLINLGAVIELVDNDNDVIDLDNQFVIAIQDDVPVLTSNTENANIYESNLVSGSAIASGSLDAVVAFGGDDQGFFLFKAQADLGNLPVVTVNGQAVSYDLDGNVLSALVNGSIVFTLELEADGDYLFTLFTEIDHAVNQEWLALDFSSAIRAVDRDGDPVDLGLTQFVVNVADNAIFNPNAGNTMYLTTSLGGVVPMEGFYGLSALDPIEGDLPALVAALIGPGGILAGGTTEDALALILEQEGVFFNEDILKLSADGYEMAFNGSENFNFETTLLNQLSLLGFSIDGLHVIGNQILFSTATGGNLPGIGSFENQDIILATQGSDGRYTFELFFDGSSQGLQDGLLNDGIFQNLLVDFNMDDFSFTSSDGSFNNGTLYFTLSNLVDVDLAYALQTLDIWGGITANGTEVLSINRTNGTWDLASLDIFFSGEDIGLTDELLGNALQALNNVDLAGLVAALLDPDTRLIEIDGLEVKGDTLYFSLAPILNVDLLFGSLGELLSNPFDPLSALTFRGEDIYSVSRNPGTQQWDVNTLKLYFDGSQYGLASNDGLLGGLLDNLPENLNAFSLTDGTEVHDTIMFSTEGGGNERQLNGYDNQTLIEYNNGEFHESFDLAAITNGSLTNRNISSVHVLDNGTVLFTLSTASTLPGNVLAGTNDVIQWNGSNFNLYFDGSSHGLADSEIINSLYVFPVGHPNAGQMAFSLANDSNLPGVGNFSNEDLIMYNPVTDTYSMLLDGSAAGISDLNLDVTVTTDLSASVAPQLDLLFNPLLTELDGLVQDAVGAIETNLTTLDGLLQQLQTVLNSNPIAILVNLVGDILSGLDTLLGTDINGLLDGLSTVTGINNLIGQLTDLVDELTPTPLSLLLNQTLVNSITSLSNTIIGQLDALDANYLSTLDNAVDSVNQGILALTASLEDAVSAGAQVQIKLLDVSVNGLHIKENGDYLLSFSQDLRADIILNLDTSFLSGLASLNLAVNTDTLITDLNDVLDPILAPILAGLNLTDVLSPQLDLLGMNIYQLHQDQNSGTWQFSLYFDGVDHGLDNGGLGNTVLDYVNSINSSLTVLDLQDLGVLHLSSNENIDAIYVNEQHGGATINGSSVGDLLIGDDNNNTFHGGMGNDLMIGGKGADTYQFDAATVTPQAPQQDVIADFKPEEGDKLTFNNIFNGYNSNPSTLGNYINISVINSDNIGGVNDTVLSLSADPGGAVVQTITLLNYVPSGADSVEMLQNLLNQGSIVT